MYQLLISLKFLNFFSTAFLELFHKDFRELFCEDFLEDSKCIQLSPSSRQRFLADSSEEEDDTPASGKTAAKRRRMEMKIDGDSRTPAINELKDLIVSTRKLSKEEIKSHENTDQSGGSGNSTSIDDDADTDVEEPGNDNDDGPRDHP